ncbi:MAG: hypothetical protein KQH67_10235 [Bacteroidetes bacterium]|nr:hypothetical protein [Bacteroidota bacterium]
MKKFTTLLTLLAILLACSLNAQVAINNDGTDATTGALLHVKVSNTNHPLFIDATSGAVSVNNLSPLAGDVFSSTATGNNWAINGYSVNGAAVFGLSNGSGSGLYGYANGSGDGIYGYANKAISTAIRGINHHNAPNDSSVVAISGAAGIASDNSTWTISLRNQQSAILGTGNGSGGIGTVGFVWGGSTSDDDIAAYFEIDYDENVTTHDGAYARIAGYTSNAYYTGYGGHFGGFFAGNQTNGDWAYVGINTYGPWGTRNYKILGPGSVSTIVKDDKSTGRIMFCPEAPEILFEDYGTGELINGEASITIDPILSKNIHVSDTHPLKVFIQLEGDCKGVYVTDKSANGFTVKELQNGTSNVSFSWHIVANRADEVDGKGNITSNNINARFPIAPKKLEPLETVASKSSLNEIKK